ncbi:scavenger receptor cysteine-rich type 1 protein M130-like [Oryzias latipes]|uniref:scavenger receptor cysteine-rich type 1 protein M130-like n=1 Tax=Oryzias latipes TaxID=8090 RepID=UPI000CE1D277|nr:scavenger receptor cysteine-rich type 1 protein M130-like [Oryzias latipes]
MERPALLLFVGLCSSGLWAEHTTGPEEFRLVGTDSRCAGGLQRRIQGSEWSDVWERNMTILANVCRRLDCGSVVSARETRYNINITCSDSVRLENGSSRCSGRLEVKSNNSWSSVCEDDFDLLDAEVVCRELGCGAPSVLQGALYGEAEAPILSREFLCEGHESVLLDCGSSWRKTKACPPDKAVGLTCSDPATVRLMGSSRCSGELQVKSGGEWRAVDGWRFERTETLPSVCKNLKCGPHVSSTIKKLPREKPVFWISSTCFDKFSLNMDECVYYDTMSSQTLEITCLGNKPSDADYSVMLENGSSRCSGRLEVKSNNSWSSVCEDDFDLLDAEVVCRELGCGAPSVLQGALYGEAEAPILSREFLCEVTTAQTPPDLGFTVDFPALRREATEIPKEDGCIAACSNPDRASRITAKAPSSGSDRRLQLDIPASLWAPSSSSRRRILKEAIRFHSSKARASPPRMDHRPQDKSILGGKACEQLHLVKRIETIAAAKSPQPTKPPATKEELIEK